MNAVLRLNLIVVAVFALALFITLNGMIEQATKDIKREVIAGVSFTHQLLSAATENEALLESLLAGETRHVHLEIVGSMSESESTQSEPEDEEGAPHWFQGLIPDLDKLQEKKYYRYLPDGRALLLRADPSDEVGEVWESVQHILMLFGLSVLLSNIAIYAGVRQGIKPVADFLSALREIEKGRYAARLNGYSIKEINELSSHFNAMAHALEEAESDNARLTHELMRIQENERAHLARELHDDLGQYLTGISAQAYLIKESAHAPELVASVGNQIAINCDAMQSSFRQLIRELHPVILEQLGLLEAIRTQVENWGLVHTGIKVTLELPEHMPDLDDERNTHIYRIVQEALNNVAQHSSANTVLIHLQIYDGIICMNINDNGKATELNKKDGLGLRSMQERAKYMQGELKFIQEPNKGSLVQLIVPVLEEGV